MHSDTIFAVKKLCVAWAGKRSRTQPSSINSKCYYDRGITDSGDWDTPLEFIRWSFKNGFALGLSLDRINNNEGYSRKNCRWSTCAEQSHNTRMTKLSKTKVKDVKILLRYGNLYQREIGTIFGVDQSIISEVKTGKIWKELEPVDRPTWVISDEEIEDVRRLLGIWNQMKARTTLGGNNSEQYIGRGITLCKEWADDFVTFVNWSLDNNYNSDLSIDRCDNNKGYYPWNCRWATSEEQNQNKRNNVLTLKTASELKWLVLNTKFNDRQLGEIYTVKTSAVSDLRQTRCWNNAESIQPEGWQDKFSGIQPGLGKNNTLTSKTASELKWLVLNTKFNDRQLGEMYGASLRVIWTIRHNTRWKNVSPVEPQVVHTV